MFSPSIFVKILLIATVTIITLKSMLAILEAWQGIDFYFESSERIPNHERYLITAVVLFMWLFFMGAVMFPIWKGL